MRLAKVVFVTSHDKEIELVNAEDWVVGVRVNGDDCGIVVCPSLSHAAITQRNPPYQMWIDNIVERMSEHVEFDLAELRSLKAYLQVVVPQLA